MACSSPSVSISPATTQADGQYDSEKAKGFEVGTRTEWLNNHLRFNVTAFRYDYIGLQVSVYQPITQTTRVANAGKVRTQGVETSVNWDAPGDIDGLNLHADLSYNKATFVNYIATCYPGQRSGAGGCNGDPNRTSGAFNTQDLAGRQVPKAPKWAGRVGGIYEFPVLGEFSLAFTGDVSFSSKYNFTDALRPDAFQKGFQKIDASVRLNAPNDRWSLALIGRNLTNEWVITSGNDFSNQQGVGGTGTATGVPGDLSAIVDRGRQVAMEFSTKF